MPTSGMASGVPIINKFATVSELNEGNNDRLFGCTSTSPKALEAVGLRE